MREVSGVRITTSREAAGNADAAVVVYFRMTGLSAGSCKSTARYGQIWPYLAQVLLDQGDNLTFIDNFRLLQRRPSQALERVQAVMGRYAREFGPCDDPFNVARMRG